MLATLALALALGLLVSACAKKQPPVAPPSPADAFGMRSEPPPPPPAPPPPPVAEPPRAPVAAETVPAEPDLGSRSLDDLNRESPFRPVFFALDSSELGTEMQTVLNGNADLMKRYPAWVVTIEGHCDARGTAEYNLALGERRALATRNYLVSVGVPSGRLRTVSYGKEFPFDPGSTEEAYARNRRAHFVLTSK
jgi:peptidoglycan-associated lipoprotein